jgi:hypothetical protein
MNKDIREMIDKIENFNQRNKITVYKNVDDQYTQSHNPIEFFAVNKDYASNFGNKQYTFIIDTTQSKILNLDVWNKLYTDKTGRGSLYGYYPENSHMWLKQGQDVNDRKNWRFEQGLFVIGSESIGTAYKEQLEIFGKYMGQNLTEKFLNEFNTCDAIYGEDAGFPNEFVFAVKNVNIVKQI